MHAQGMWTNLASLCPIPIDDHHSIALISSTGTGFSIHCRLCSILVFLQDVADFEWSYWHAMVTPVTILLTLGHIILGRVVEKTIPKVCWKTCLRFYFFA